MKRKFSVSVDEELCKWLDEKIIEKRFASRAHGVEYAVSELRKTMLNGYQ